MSTIVLVPIDNRPVCYTLPKMIVAQDKAHSLLLPPENLLGNLTKIADINKILDWLDSLNQIDIAVISLDTIAYGGLIPSRRSNDDIDTIKQRIDNLVKILKKKKSVVFAFSSIMRISNNNINEEEKEYWSKWGQKIFQYSFDFHKYGNIETDIPTEILQDYLFTRNRNFEINKYYIELKRQGIIDTLVFSKDDCAQYGFNVKEARELQKQYFNQNSIYIKTGADEIPLTLISRAINETKKIKIYPVYTNPNSIDKISKYEDISVKESVESQIKFSGILSNKNDCDMILLVNNFEQEQGELVMGVDVPLFKSRLELPNKPFCIADIVNANGSDNNFIAQLLTKNLSDFYGYAGWNTTGNTLGSVLAGAMTYYGAEIPDKNAFSELQTVRLLDDWAYQANVRQQLRNNISNLTPEILKTNMEQYEKILFKHFHCQKEISYYFPWHRFFEIGIIII